jgi:hypothetical protein
VTAVTARQTASTLSFVQFTAAGSRFLIDCQPNKKLARQPCRSGNEVLAMTTANVVTKVCLGCEERLKDASEAMRRHGAEMNTAIYVARSALVTAFSIQLEEARAEWRRRNPKNGGV